MPFMRLFLRFLLAPTLTFGLALALAATAVRAQDQPGSRPPASDTSNEDEPVYTPPGAPKSVEIGNYYFRKKQYRAALSRYEEATQTDPYYAQGYLGLGKAYEKIGLKLKALDAYQRYLDLLPSEKQADEAKKVHEAIARLERSLRKPGSPQSALRKPTSVKQ
ncbi:MAG TPA: tetratricopeptide repeat protein [Terriglobia bacterium]|nr:tetratricopeptide repeat protein [Terriglobia bacterium]